MFIDYERQKRPRCPHCTSELDGGGDPYLGEYGDDGETWEYKCNCGETVFVVTNSEFSYCTATSDDRRDDWQFGPDEDAKALAT